MFTLNISSLDGCFFLNPYVHTNATVRKCLGFESIDISIKALLKMSVFFLPFSENFVALNSYSNSKTCKDLKTFRYVAGSLPHTEVAQLGFFWRWKYWIFPFWWLWKNWTSRIWTKKTKTKKQAGERWIWVTFARSVKVAQVPTIWINQALLEI